MSATTDSTKHAKRALGRGLRALIPAETTAITSEADATAVKVATLAVGEIDFSPFQPREVIDETRLDELVRSMTSSGILQPVLVRPKGGRFELIAGERRLRAAQRLGWQAIPAIIRHADDQEAMEMGLLENLQREDLNPVDEARAYHRLTQEFGLSQEDVAQAIGKDRSTVANTLRLLQLPEAIMEALRSSLITRGHAKAILALATPGAQLRLFERITRERLPVRAAEGMSVAWTKRATRRRTTGDPHLRAAEEQLQRALGTRVRMTQSSKRRGRIVIEYYSSEDLERLLQRLSRP